VRSGVHVDPLTRHSPALRSTGGITFLKGYEQAKMIPTPPIILKAPYSSLSLLFGPLK